MKRYYTTRETAILLGVTPETVRTWIHKKYIDAKDGGSCGGYLVDEDSIFRFAYTRPNYRARLSKTQIGMRFNMYMTVVNVKAAVIANEVRKVRINDQLTRGFIKNLLPKE